MRQADNRNKVLYKSLLLTRYANQIQSGCESIIIIITTMDTVGYARLDLMTLIYCQFHLHFLHLNIPCLKYLQVILQWPLFHCRNEWFCRGDDNIF